jgi:Zn finger protein HypA/HybF involved in hydrogenase expression
MKPRKNVLYSIRKNGIIDIHDNFISVYSRTQIHRHGSPDEIFVNYGDDYWKINMDLCGRCFQSESIRQNPILYCDLKNCNQSFHLLCLSNQDPSQLRQSPWFCPACVQMTLKVTVDDRLIMTSEEKKKSILFARPSRAASALTAQRHPSKRKVDEQQDETNDDDDVIDLTSSSSLTTSSFSSTTTSSTASSIISSSSSTAPSLSSSSSSSTPLSFASYKRPKSNYTPDDRHTPLFVQPRMSSSSSSSVASHPILRSTFTPDDAIQLPSWSPALKQIPPALGAKVNNSSKRVHQVQQ